MQIDWIQCGRAAPRERGAKCIFKRSRRGSGRSKIQKESAMSEEYPQISNARSLWQFSTMLSLQNLQVFRTFSLRRSSPAEKSVVMISMFPRDLSSTNRASLSDVKPALRHSSGEEHMMSRMWWQMLMIGSQAGGCSVSSTA